MDRRVKVIKQLENMGYKVSVYRDPFVEEITVSLGTKSGRGWLVKLYATDFLQDNIVEVVVNKFNYLISRDC